VEHLDQIVSARIPELVDFDWDVGSDFEVDCPGRNLGDFSILDCRCLSKVVLRSEIIFECIDLFRTPLSKFSPITVYDQVIASTTNRTSR
jgi:hypothetical protein